MSDDSHLNETYKSLITISIEGFKFCALANGGAAVAILAYLGNVAAKTAPVPDMQCAMAGFLAGLAVCGLAMICSYITQLQLYNEALAKRNPEDYNGIRFFGKKIPHTVFLCPAIIFVVLSLVAFSWGSWQGVREFGSDRASYRHQQSRDLHDPLLVCHVLEQRNVSTRCSYLLVCKPAH